MEKDKLIKRTNLEILSFNNGIDYGIYVALLKKEVVGFCRFFESQNVPEILVKYSFPNGMYCMGISVKKEYRHQGIAKFISTERFKLFRSLKVKEIYSCVDVKNLTSIKMHLSLGFKEQERSNGFLTISFEESEGILYKKLL